MPSAGVPFLAIPHRTTVLFLDDVVLIMWSYNCPLFIFRTKILSPFYLIGSEMAEGVTRLRRSEHHHSVGWQQV